MQNFTFYNPTKIYFGKGEIANLNLAIKEATGNKKRLKIMLTYGKGSIKQNGVYKQIIAELRQHKLIEFSGIEPNPTYETLMRAVLLARKEKIDFIVAAGGGSVIDGTKFIAAAINFKGDPWQVLTKPNAKINNAIPFGTILTLPGTGSEMNSGAVISRTATHDKLVFMHDSVFPRFSILDPATTFSLSVDQTCNGIVDAFIHVTEQYLTYPANAPLQDRLAEGILATLIEEAPKVLLRPRDYAARANIMWCAAMALNGYIVCGVPEDWATHRIGHQLTAKYGLDHAKTLAVILPSLLRIQKHSKKEKLLQYATRVWGITKGGDDQKIEQAISQTEKFFHSLNMATKLNKYGIGKETVAFVTQKLKQHGQTKLGERGNITPTLVAKILRMSLE